MLARVSISALLVLVAAGCGPMTPSASPAAQGTPVPGGSGVCVSGQTFHGDESPLMNPGLDCVGCHESSGEAPRLAVAGTVYSAYDEPDYCVGRSGVDVVVTGANGTELTLHTNASGNFMLRQSDANAAGLTMPIHAEVHSNGAINAMSAAQSTGACNTCHSQHGADGAPGRIVAP